ncbi:MAG: hypothetical protein AAFX75_14565 [Pseudomonadota bacterium]
MSEETKAESYSIRLTGPGLTIDREIPKELAEQVVLLVMTGQAPRVAAIPATPAAPGSAVGFGGGAAPAAPAADLSVREYLDQSDAKRVPDKITAMAMYLRDVRSQSHFKRSDMVDMFQEASERVPKNLSRDINWAAKAAWIAPKPGTSDTYYITKSGSDAVDARFSKEVVQKTRGMTAGSTKKKKASTKK